jgi:drug/metabolite transporter (DMT)-like permease
MKTAAVKADVLLLIAAAIWGSGFVAQRMGMEHVGPMTFTGVRFAIGTFIVLTVLLIRHARAIPPPPRPEQRHTRVYLIGGTLAGGVMFVAAALQQIGLIYTTAGKAGFITGLYLVLVPILGLLIGRRTFLPTWLGAAIATVGLYLLSVTGSFEINRGDGFVLACAVVWAAHVLLIGHLSPRTDPLKLAATQFAVTAVLGMIATLITEEITLQRLVDAKWAILYSGVFSVGIAFTLQVVAQREAPPAHAAILLSLEAVFAATAGWWLLAELLGLRELLGCALMLAGGLVSTLGTRAARAAAGQRCRANPRQSSGMGT